MRYVLATALALMLTAACDKQPDTTQVASADETNQQEMVQKDHKTATGAAVDKELAEFQKTTKEKFAELDARLQKATDRIDDNVEDFDEEMEANGKQMEGDAKMVATDVKTRLDRLGNDIDKAAAKTDEDLQKLKFDINDRMKKLDRDIANLVSKDDEDAS